MKKTAKIKQTLARGVALLGVGILSVILQAKTVSALAGGDVSGQTECYDYECYSYDVGDTWVFYKYSEEPSSDTTVPIYLRTERTADVASSCYKYGGFYVLESVGYWGSKGSHPGYLSGHVLDAHSLAYHNDSNHDYTYLTESDIDDGLYSGSLEDSGDGVYISSYGESWSSIKAKFQAMDWEDKSGYSWSSSSGLTWFCYDDTYKATFSGSSTATVNGSNYSGNNNRVNTDSQYTTITFNHKLKRTDSHTNKYGASRWTIQKNENGAGYKDVKGDKATTDSGKHSETETDSITVDLAPNETTTVCEKITYNYGRKYSYDENFISYVKSNGDTTDDASESNVTSSQTCVTIARRYNTQYDGNIYSWYNETAGPTHSGTDALNNATTTYSDSITKYYGTSDNRAYFYETLRRKTTAENPLDANAKARSAWNSYTKTFQNIVTSPSSAFVFNSTFSSVGKSGNFDQVASASYSTVNSSQPFYRTITDGEIQSGDKSQLCEKYTYQNSKWYNANTYSTASSAEYSAQSSRTTTTSKAGCVTFWRPWNFKTKVTSTITNDTAYVGETLDTKFTVTNAGEYWDGSNHTNATDSTGSNNVAASATPSDGKLIAIQFTLPSTYSYPGGSTENQIPDALKGVVEGTLVGDGSTYSSTEVPANARNDNYSDLCSWANGRLGNNARDCTELDSKTTGFSSEDYIKPTVSIPDSDDYIGRKICVAAGYDYAQSDTNNGYNQQTRKWAISSISCRTISKKPSIAVTGGSVYASKGIATSTSTRYSSLNSLIPSNSASEYSRYTFGSWTEYLAVNGGLATTGSATTGFSSGAGLYRRDHTTITADTNYGGYRDGVLSLCDTSTLSITNIDCDGSPTRTSLSASGISASPIFLNSILGHFLSDGSARSDLANTKVYYFGNSVNIVTGNTLTSNSIGASRLTSSADDGARKIVIAKNINISSDVTSVDAWLIASNENAEVGTIDTCTEKHLGYKNDSDSANALTANSTCGNHLVINGVVYAGVVNFDRTAGGDNVYSGSSLRQNRDAYAAEVINLSASDYLWAYHLADATSSLPTEVYGRELAPRR